MKLFHVSLAALLASVALGAARAGAADDPLPAQSVWTNADLKMTLTVTERVGESFRARFQIGETIDRVVTGTVKDNKVSWLAKDVRADKGSAGGDNHGTIGADAIDFIWRDDKGGSGKFVLTLTK